MCSTPNYWVAGTRRNPLEQKIRHSPATSTAIPRIAKLSAVPVLFLLAAPVQAQDLPEGAGKETVMKVCTVCHDTFHFTSKRRTQEEWNKTVDLMATRGAQASDEEFDAIVAYLAKNFGKDKPLDKPAKDEPAKDAPAK